MSVAQENNPKNYLIITGILLVFTLLFIILFRIEDSVDQVDATQQDAKLFYMIPGLDTTNLEVLNQARKDNLDLRELAARDSFDDPTIMSFPNKKYGFSLERDDTNEPPKPFIEEYHLPLIAVEAPVSERTPLVGIFPDPGEDDTGSLLPPEIGEIELTAQNNAKPDRIVWLENGKEITAPIKAEDAIKIAAGKAPALRTEIKIEKLSTSPVIFLTAKCGVAALDKMVMDHIRLKLTKVFTGELKTAELPDTVSVDWRLILR